MKYWTPLKKNLSLQVEMLEWEVSTSTLFLKELRRVLTEVLII